MFNFSENVSSDNHVGNLNWNLAGRPQRIQKPIQR